ncbi:MAG: phosphate ABC transporter permease PstA [Bacteroidia bacterium]
MSNIKLNRFKDNLFRYVGLFCTFLGLLVLLVFILDIVVDGVQALDIGFLTSLPSRKAEDAGILPAWVGSIWIMVLTAFITFPLGVAAGIHLEEYGKKNWLTSLLEINIANLAGVPSIIYGLLGLEIFSRLFGLGPSVLTGSLTLALLILPIVIVSTREALKAVPKSLREASYAMGASKWQTIWHQVIPASFGGILTGVILALSRAVGETAPLIVIGALTYVPYLPEHPLDEFTVLPIQIFNWVTRPQQAFSTNAAAAIIVLLALTFFMNGVAIYLRNRHQNKLKW